MKSGTSKVSLDGCLEETALKFIENALRPTM